MPRNKEEADCKSPCTKQDTLTLDQIIQEDRFQIASGSTFCVVDKGWFI